MPSPTTFIHTADWQIGKPYARVADTEKRALIRRERLLAIDRLGALARERGATFVLVAGDLFDTPTASKATVSQACGALGAIGVPVLVIPGNHDHGGPGSLWEQEFFLRERDSLAPNLRVLLTPEPVELESAVIFPCPLLRRHEAIDPTAWLRGLDAESLAGYGEKPRLVLAHGSIQDFGGGDDEEDAGGVPNLIDLDRLPEDLFDYIALGDWHGTKQVGPRAWYAGTPEPDRFSKGDSNLPGHALAVTVARGGDLPEVEVVSTGALGWHQLAFEFTGDEDLHTLEERIDALIARRAARDLLRLELRGTLGIEATTRLEERLEAWEARLLRLKLSNDTRITPTDAEIEALTRRGGDPLISRVATKLLEKSRASDADEAALARVALRELHAAANAT